MTTYEMKPIQSKTRLRAGHDVFASVIIPDLTPADTLQGDEVWTCPIDGVEARKNDKWLYVTHRNGVELGEKGWTAIIHKGVPICDNVKEVTTTPPVNPPVVEFPQSYILTDNDPKSPNYGKRAEYVFFRVIE